MAKKDLPFGSSVPKGFSKPVDDTGTFIGPGYYDQPSQFLQKSFKPHSSSQKVITKEEAFISKAARFDYEGK